jgi:WD40 repeat protein
MMTQITQSDSGQFLWSPDRAKLAYITPEGVQAYVMDGGHTNGERYVQVVTGQFNKLHWSPDGSHLCASAPDGTLLVFRFQQGKADLVHEASASSLEWIDSRQLLYVPTDGGLVMLDLEATPIEFRLAG